MDRQWRGWLALVALAAGLAACQTPAPRAHFPDLTYRHLGQFRLDVSGIEVVNEYQAPLAPPHVEHLLPVRADAALRRWAEDRLAATGKPGRYARFVILDARVTETKLAKTPGLRGAFTTDQAERYDGALSAAIEIRAERGNFRDGYASATVTRFRTVPEGISVNDREKTWFELVEAMMSDLNLELDRQVRGHLGMFLR
ncbi:MAG: hypothetical protein ACT4P2_02355 [Pseudomonadota bacterium]